MKEREYLYWLCHIPLLGAVTILQLKKELGSFQAVWRADGKELEKTGKISVKKAEAIAQWKGKLEDCSREYDRLTARGIRIITILDADYPARLENLYDRPPCLFVKGRLPEDHRPCAAIVGARRCSEYGRQVAEIFSSELASSGIGIVSGLALGIDGAAHRGALKGKGATYGVLGCGIDNCYPRENYALFEAMEKEGGIVTEFVPGTKPVPMNFPMRNRIISGLADIVIIIEAREKSGSLITADMALEQGRDVYAVPGRLTDQVSAGCNRLIQGGASVALSPSDILDFFGLKYDKKLLFHKKTEIGLAKKEKLVYSCLDLQPKHLEEIMEFCRLPVAECMECLLELELLGLAAGAGNQYYCRKL